MIEQAETTTPYFQTPQVQNHIEHLFNISKQIEDKYKREKQSYLALWNLAKFIMNKMVENPKHWDIICPYSIAKTGHAFLSFTPEKNELEFFSFIDVLVRFYYEAHYRDPKLDVNYQQRMQEISNLAKQLPQLEDNIRYTTTFFCGEIVKYTVTQSLYEQSNQSQRIAQEIEKHGQELTEWEKKQNAFLADKTAEVDRLELELKKHKEGFNFVCLYDGFNKLADKKHRESKIHLTVLVCFAVVIVLLLGYKIVYTNPPTDNVSKQLEDILNIYIIIKTVATISLLGILIYFFRVVLIRYKEIQSEILQLELRKSLCSFIQGYGEYAKNLQDTHKISLEKFENLIFSGIVSNSEKLPSTYDGMDVIAKILNSIGPKK